MLLVADSGSTKTQWLLDNGGEERLFESQGLNPHFTTDDQFLSVCSEIRMQAGLTSSDAVLLYFYGAGCGSEGMQLRVKGLLSTVFGNKKIFVAGDLLGACHAVCGSSAGLVGILGTGSNLCYYDGCSIARQRISTGFILGDEGSGNHIGRSILKDYLEQRMPEDLSCQFDLQYSYSPSQWLDKLYHQPNPNRFLASLAPFAAQHRADSYIQQLLEQCFRDFFRQLDFYSDLPAMPLHLVGGVATAFEPELRRVAAAKGVLLGTLLGYPLPRLAEYCKTRRE